MNARGGPEMYRPVREDVKDLTKRRDAAPRELHLRSRRNARRQRLPARARHIERASVVGDSVWDMLAARRARTLGIGLLSGGYGMDELERAGAYRVYEDPQDMLKHLDEVGGRR
jgi:phosphoglycolate phosphatase-like HAD superfamily hydrolase